MTPLHVSLISRNPVPICSYDQNMDITAEVKMCQHVLKFLHAPHMLVPQWERKVACP